MSSGLRTDEERNMDADIQAAEPPILVKAAAVAQALTGLFVTLTGVQVLGVTWRAEWANYVPPALCVMGALAIFFAAMQYRARAWAGIASAINGGLLGLLMVGWLFYTFTTVLSCMMYLAIPLSGLSAILNLVSIGAILRTAQARQRLSDRGLDLGL
ncbi:MAG: hypothetical protein H6719_15690 [Sandaracinaceae bacterium]|nr:hypothetical protein [Sandaracinaceae bacterium]